MSCERYEEELIDHGLGEPATAGLTAHVAACAACRGRLDEERRLAGTVDQMLAATLDVNVASTFERGVRRHIEARRRPISSARWGWTGGVAASAAAAAIAVAVLASRPSRPPATRSAEARATVVVSPTPSAETRPVEPREPPRRLAVQVREIPKSPAVPETIVPSSEQQALLLYARRVRIEDAPRLRLSPKPPPVFEPAALEVGALQDLPRITTSELSSLDRPEVINPVLDGGGV
jgi:anti-sigma factor RsiW